MLKTVLIIVGVIVVAAAAFMVVQIGPRNVIGMMLYDRRREGDLKVGERAPDVWLVTLDGSTRVSLVQARAGRPLVLIFGSFT